MTLNISAADNAMDLARSVAHYFRLSGSQANEIISRQQQIGSQWDTIAASLGIPTVQRGQFSISFRLAEQSAMSSV
ncbi:hypothetical protein ACFWP0_13495 [Achromobacter sp. NPDC058515]|uniref:hypothetical protein n=1 Tax=Achromobacter sp. NPDC058515 TaxID=3346533 RepID=UPI003663F31E